MASLDENLPSSPSSAAGDGAGPATPVPPVTPASSTPTAPTPGVPATPPTAPATTAASAAGVQRQGTNPLLVTTIVLLVAVVALIAYLVGSRGVGGNEAPAASTTQSSAADSSDAAASTDQGDSSDSGTSTGSDSSASADPEYAPSLTNEQALAILRAEPQRDPSDARALGAVDAPVVLVEFSDFSCPMCARFGTDAEPALAALIEAGTLRVEYRDFVIFADHGSDIAAAGGWAAAEQGLYHEYRAAVWEAADPNGHAEYTEDSVVELASKAGVPDLDKFRATMTSPDTKAKVEAESTHAQQIGIGGTPFIMVNDAAISGAYPADFVVRTVEEQAKLATQ